MVAVATLSVHLFDNNGCSSLSIHALTIAIAVATLNVHVLTLAVAVATFSDWIPLGQ